MGNIAVDLVKAAAVACVSWTIGSLMLATSVAGSSVIFVIAMVFTVGFMTTYALDVIDKKFKISETVVNIIVLCIRINKLIDYMKCIQTYNIF
ncbi:MULTISPECIES: hypothetical protein [Photorhabdus]|uniref:hypothetical protein n=1 Tax=Photorhabdus TaxID=29487 RepID=UPI00069BEF54|nr:hypothetical protein [Photorhabdus thracensis]